MNIRSSVYRILVSFLVVLSGSLVVYSANAAEPAEIKVDFSWKGIEECSVASPVLKITKIPSETKFLKIVMEDDDYADHDHGGNTIPYKGNGTIPKDGVGGSYNGPCCGSKCPHAYTFTIFALGGDEKTVLGVGFKTNEFPPE